jgi:c-di-GMP-related signal transduction protein
VALIDREVSLCYKLLRFVNSARFGFRRNIASTRHAVELLGDQALKKWASIAAVLGMAGDQPNELVLTLLTRGRCCELMAKTLGAHDDEESLFLLGVFSLMDAILGRPIAEIVAEISLPEMVRVALLGTPNRYREILDWVTAFEAGRWSEVSERALGFQQGESQLPAAFLEAVDWAQKLFTV